MSGRPVFGPVFSILRASVWRFWPRGPFNSFIRSRCRSSNLRRYLGATISAVREAVANAAIDPAQVVSIGVDATCSLVAVGAQGEPVSVAVSGESAHDIIMWMDHRAGAQAAALNATGDPALAYVGGEVSIEMELPKVLWLKQHFPERYAATWRFFDLADWSRLAFGRCRY